MPNRAQPCSHSEKIIINAAVEAVIFVKACAEVKVFVQEQNIEGCLFQYIAYGSNRTWNKIPVFSLDLLWLSEKTWATVGHAWIPNFVWTGSCEIFFG